MKTKNLWLVSVDFAKRSSLATLNESNASDEKLQKPRKFTYSIALNFGNCYDCKNIVEISLTYNEFIDRQVRLAKRCNT